jgi:ribose 5-phosphate isomerase A
MPFAWQLVKQQLEELGGEGGLRPNSNGSGLAVTSYGSLVLDMKFDPKLEISQLDGILNATPGVVEHGIFYKLASLVLCSVNGEVVEN